MWFHLATKYNWFPCDWRFECAEVGTKEILYSFELQSSNGRGGKDQKCPGQKLGWTSVYPADLFGPQRESKPVQTRTQQGRCFNRGRGGTTGVLLVCWRRWMEGRKKNKNARHRRALQKKSGVSILVKNSPSISRVFLHWRNGSCQQYDT